MEISIIHELSSPLRVLIELNPYCYSKRNNSNVKSVPPDILDSAETHFDLKNISAGGKGHLGLPVGGLLLGGGGLGGAVPLVLVPAELFEAERGRYDLPGRVLPLLRLWEGRFNI